MSFLKILFVQLPLSDRGNNFSSGNYPYGPYAIGQYLKKTHPGKADIAVMDPLFVNTMNDVSIAREAVSTGADIISFSVFSWNAERSLRIAAYISEVSDAKIFFGGPEIARGSFLFEKKQSTVNLFVQGEGEWFFDRYLSGDVPEDYAEDLNGNRLISQPMNELIPAECLCEPYGEGALPYIRGTFAFSEITRGCPWRCSYCMYSRRAFSVREQPDDVLLRAVSRAVSDSASGLYVLSPSFIADASDTGVLSKLASMNHAIPLHSEMRTDNVTPERAVALYRAGFRSMEVGLQTMTSKAIDKAGRRSIPAREVDGMGILKKHGIDLKIGLIPGLPGDTPEQFRLTVDILSMKGLAQSAEAYPLMVLPGTAIRDSAAQENIEYMNKPPYYFLRSDAFSSESIKETRAYLEAESGESSRNNQMPQPVSKSASITGGVIIDCSQPIDAAMLESIMPQTHCVTVRLCSADPSSIVSIAEKVCSVYDHDEALLTFAIESDQLFPDKKLFGYVKSVEGDSYFKRSRFYHEEKESCRIRFFQIINSADSYLDAVSGYDYIDALLVYNERNAKAVYDEEWQFLPEIFIPEGQYHPQKESLSSYRDNPDMVCFESYDDMSAFYKFHKLVLPDSAYGYKLAKIN